MSDGIFISSVYKGLEDLRQQMKDAAEEAGLNPWIFEKVEELRKASPQESQRICLNNVDVSDLYVAVFHRGYGSSSANHLADISLVDLEFFEAFKEQKPIRVYILEPFDPEPNLSALVEIVRSLVPDSIRICPNKKFLLSRFRRDLDSYRATVSTSAPTAGTRIFTRFLHRLCDYRRGLDQGLGLRFLADKYPPPSGRKFSRDIAEEHLAALASFQNWHERLDQTWEVITSLFEVPWQDRRYSEFLPLWDQAFGSWDKSSAWVGLHGPLLMGKLAADNSLLAVRALRASHGELVTLQSLLSAPPSKTGTTEEWADLYSLGGAIASEYYSIAKMAITRSTMHYYFKRSEDWLRCALRSVEIRPNPIQEAGISAIWGHVSLGLGKVDTAIEHFEKSLNLLIEYGASAGSVAEVEADLGYALIRSGKIREGEKLLLRGVEGLERAMSRGFTARAKRMLAAHYARRGHLREALIQLAQVTALCQKHGITDRPPGAFWLRLVHAAAHHLWRGIPKYEVVETPRGYQYLETAKESYSS